MTAKKKSGIDAGELRRRAENVCQESAEQKPELLDEYSPEAARELVHELRVHQIELEMQNEELKSAQEELETSRTRYYDIYNLAPVGYVTISARGLIEETNLTLAKLLGLTRQALARRPFSQLILPADQDVYYLQHRRLSSAGAAQACSLRLKKGDGTHLWAQLEMMEAKDSNGETGMRIVVVDISEIKRVERLVEEKEVSLRTIIETIPDMIWLKNPEGAYLSCNKMLERFFGAKESEIVGKTDYDFLDKALADFFREYDCQAISGGKSSRNIKEVAFADDGRRVILETIKTPMYDADGAMVGVLGVARDVTERNAMEEALRNSEKRFQNLIKELPLPLAILNRAGEYTYINDRFVEIFGYTLNDIPTREKWRELAFTTELAVENWVEAIAVATSSVNDVEPVEYNIDFAAEIPLPGGYIG